ncbi:MAG: hypothetical protein HC836_47740 [Richelia sp. RM2_1_2]|nr:hypothetical protein [Richelia sp. RM2_1_2]
MINKKTKLKKCRFLEERHFFGKNLITGEVRSFLGSTEIRELFGSAGLSYFRSFLKNIRNVSHFKGWIFSRDQIFKYNNMDELLKARKKKYGKRYLKNKKIKSY